MTFPRVLAVRYSSGHGDEEDSCTSSQGRMGGSAFHRLSSLRLRGNGEGSRLRLHAVDLWGFWG